MINKCAPPTSSEVEGFLKLIDFELPVDFIIFYSSTNGADIDTGKNYIFLWPLNELILKNKEYETDKYLPDYFLFGSNGGGEAYVIEKKSGHIFIIPFTNMNKEDAILKYNNFYELLKTGRNDF